MPLIRNYQPQPIPVDGSRDRNHTGGDYRKAVAKEPNRPGLRYRLGEALLAKAGETGQASEALENFELELATNPSHTPSAVGAGSSTT